MNPFLSIEVHDSVKYFKWQDFPKVHLKMVVTKRISTCFAWKDTNWMQKFLNGKKLNFLLPTTSASHNFPKNSLLSLFSMALLTNENQRTTNQAQGHQGLKMQENINMQAMVQILKIHVNEFNYCIWDSHWWAGLWAYQIITQIIAFWDFGYFYSLICKQNFYNKLFLTKSYLENCLYRKPRE